MVPRPVSGRSLVCIVWSVFLLVPPTPDVSAIFYLCVIALGTMSKHLLEQVVIWQYFRLGFPALHLLALSHTQQV